MTYKLVLTIIINALAIVISCSVYNNNMRLTLVLICSDTTFVFRDDIQTCSDNCSRLFWHLIRFVLAITEYITVIKKYE
jgi:hypothetical protein